jgi:uncharacterized protein YdeI (YjbR/CyaY-like superfamily)
MASQKDAPLFHPESRQAWREWLAANHDGPGGVWVVSWRSSTRRSRVPYDDLIEEALCFGWVDSTARTLDDERGALWFARRKPGSGWARTNKERVARLAAAGLLAGPGKAVIEAAKADGSWTLLDDVEDLRVPDDLCAAFAQYPGSLDHWEAFPPSARKLALTWIVQAKRPETRAARVLEVARKSAAGERPR